MAQAAARPTVNPLAPPVWERPARPAWLSRWAAFAAAMRPEDLPGPVLAQARTVLLDTIGAIAAGAQEPEILRLADRLIGAEGVPPVGAAVIGRGRRASPGTAAFLNGTAGTMLELDEGNQFARGHPAIHVVPALLARAAARPVSGAELLTALVLGYEIGARIGIGSKLRPTMHPHGTWGTVGAALAVAKLDGAGAERLAEIVNLASTLGLATSRRTMLEGGTVRNTFAGFSNQIGIMTVALADAGFVGEADGVGTIFGSVAAEDWRPDAMTEALGERWEIARNYFKRHACCRYNHGALDALAQIVAQHGPIAPDQIARIDVATYVWAAQLAGQEPHNMLAAKFSLPFSLATTIVHGAATVEAFRKNAIGDDTIRALARRIHVVEDAALTAQLPRLRPARLTITLADGRLLQADVATNRGDAEDPYSTAEVEAKFHALAGPVWGRAGAGRVAEAIAGLAPGRGVAPLLDLLAKPAVAR